LKAAGTKGLQAVGKQALKDAQAIHKTATAAHCLKLYVECLGKSVWADECRTRCGRFVRRFGEGRPISEATPAAMIDYFSKHPDKTGRRTISAWFSWAVEEGYLPSNPCAKKRTPRGKKRKVKRGEAVILPPANAASLLQAAVKAEDWTALSFVVLGLFAGVRPMEFRKKFKGAPAVNLEWSDVKPDGIEIRPELAKTGTGRVVPIHSPLADWIEFIRKRRRVLAGPVLATGKRGGGWRKHWEQFRANHWPHKWHVDLLRHSYGSYRMAQIKDAERVSHEMGNSPDVVLRHYWNWRTKEADALEFWALTPEVVMSKGLKAAPKKTKKPA
jgi:integrase